MLRYILTSACNRDCPYCITRNLADCKESTDRMAIIKLFRTMWCGYSEIMLTGGEPTLHPFFNEILAMSAVLFEKVHLTTADRDFLRQPQRELLSSITISMHDSLDKKSDYFKALELGSSPIPIYASCLPELFREDDPWFYKDLGFSGLTINEEQRNGYPFTMKLPEIENFSIKVNRRGHCMNDTFILPDLSVTTDFTPYL